VGKVKITRSVRRHPTAEYPGRPTGHKTMGAICARRKQKKNRNGSISIEITRWIQACVSNAAAGAVAGWATGCKTYHEQNRVIQYCRRQSDQKQRCRRGRQARGLKTTTIRTPSSGAWNRARCCAPTASTRDSNKAFAAAQEKMDDYAQKGQSRLGQETGAMFSNQADVDYEGRATTASCLNTYRALKLSSHWASTRPDGTHRALPAKAGKPLRDNAKAHRKSPARLTKNKDSAAIQKGRDDGKRRRKSRKFHQSQTT